MRKTILDYEGVPTWFIYRAVLGPHATGSPSLVIIPSEYRQTVARTRFLFSLLNIGISLNQATNKYYHASANLGCTVVPPRSSANKQIYIAYIFHIKPANYTFL